MLAADARRKSFGRLKADWPESGRFLIGMRLSVAYTSSSLKTSVARVVINSSEIKSERRQQIQTIAKQVFSRKGFHNTTVSDIIQQADIARGTFYLYFESKRDVFDKLLDVFLEEIRGCIEPIDLGEGKPKPLDQLKDNIGRILNLVRRDPDLIQILFHHAAGLDERSAETLRNFYDRVLIMIQRSLEHGTRLGLVRPCDTRIVASCILGSIKEVADSLTTGRGVISAQDSLVEEIIRFGLRGIFSQPHLLMSLDNEGS
jgi:TetR/AcrR family fatty acid metabolism transcriptional regulator